MDPSDFDRDLQPWLDGELPPEAAARMQAAADACPELTERVALHRALDGRIRGALASEPAAVATVRAMAARARGRTPSIARRPWYFRPVAAAAAVLIVTGVVLWTFCIGPFECRYLIALEKAADDVAAVPGPAADELLRRSGLPDHVGDAVRAEPAVALPVDFIDLHTPGLRVIYVRPDRSSFCVTLSECATRRPSANRRTSWGGKQWWMTDYDDHRLVAFDCPKCPFVYCVLGPVGEEHVFEDAAALREAMR